LDELLEREQDVNTFLRLLNLVLAADEIEIKRLKLGPLAAAFLRRDCGKAK
jgi:hypothetical protein